MRLVGIYSNPIIVSGYEYNLLIYPVSDADIRIRISAEGVIHNQLQRISSYLYPTTAQKTYPDNPWSTRVPHLEQQDSYRSPAASVGSDFPRARLSHTRHTRVSEEQGIRLRARRR